MSNNYDKIATVSISIASAIVDNTSFDSILIVGPLPKVAPKKAPSKVGVYSSIDEVAEAGWVTTGDGADPVGVAARIAFSQDPTPSAVYIAPLQEEDGKAEYAVSAVQRAVDTSGWYVVCPAGIDDDELETVAEYIETQEKMMVYTELNFFNDGDNKPTVSQIYNRTAGIYGGATDDPDDEVPEANKYMNVAFAVAWLANEAGSETAAFKKMYGVTPSELGSTSMKTLETESLNYFTTIGGKNISMIGKVLSGEWCDIIRFRDWLKNDMQVRVVNLFLTLPKVPYTDEGISLIHNQMEASLKYGQEKGGICPTEYDEDGNATPGYEVSVPMSMNISDSTKASRNLTDCTFKAKLAGAIHFAELTGTLTYSL
jgi:hypothetical protein